MASVLRPKSGFVLVFLLGADKLTYSQSIGWAPPILIYFSEVLAKGFILKKKKKLEEGHLCFHRVASK